MRVSQRSLHEGYLTLRHYLDLTAPGRVARWVLLLLTAMLVAARGQPLDLGHLLITALAGALAAAGATALHQGLTAGRNSQPTDPTLPIAPVNALLFGLGLITWSVLLLLLADTLLAAGLALLGALGTAAVGALRNRPAPADEAMGGVTGALLVLVGWAAAVGTLDVGALTLAAIPLLWTPPHHGARVLAGAAAASHPLPPVIAGGETIRIRMLIYLIHLVPLTLLPVLSGLLSGYYLIAAALLGAHLLWQALQGLTQPSPQQDQRVAAVSSAYLLLLALSMLGDRLLVMLAW